MGPLRCFNVIYEGIWHSSRGLYLDPAPLGVTGEYWCRRDAFAGNDSGSFTGDRPTSWLHDHKQEC